MSKAILNTIGLGLALLGVLVLFRYGMPFRVPADGGSVVVTNPTDEGEAEEAMYKLLGWIGLTFAVVGTALQAISNFWPER
jgi:hypothetical protein